MSVAEYIAAFVSIMVGLALADLATSLQRLLRAGKRVRWDFLTPAAGVLTTAFVINVWWATFGALNAMQSISVGAFIPDLISLLLLFCLASSALPDEVGDEIFLADYYWDNQRRFWGLFATYTIWVTIVVGVRGSLAGVVWPSLIGSALPNLVLAALMIILAVTRRKWAHLLIITLLLIITGLAWLPQEIGRSS